jgi:hypothetical protein
MIVLALITVVSVYLGPETYRRGMMRKSGSRKRSDRSRQASLDSA